MRDTTVLKVKSFKQLKKIIVSAWICLLANLVLEEMAVISSSSVINAHCPYHYRNHVAETHDLFKTHRHINMCIMYLLCDVQTL